MFSRKLLSRLLALFISLATVTAPLAAQHKTPPEKTSPVAPAQKPAPKAVADKPGVAIDTFLAADTYKIYGEVKNVGTLATTGSLAELIDPILKLADPPKEMKTLVKFINANAETLADSRLIFATWPARPGVPDAVFVIELASPEDAVKFEPKLNRMLPTILPTPAPTPAESPKPDAGTAPKAEEAKGVDEPGAKTATPKPARPPFVVTRSGSLIFAADRPFKFQSLRPADSKLLTEDQNFRQAHERFSNEPVFVFVNVALQFTDSRPPIAKPTVDAAEQARLKAEAEAEAQKDAADPEPAEEAPGEEKSVELVTTVSPQQTEPTGVLSAGPAASPTPPQVSAAVVGSIMNLLGGGPPEWPDAIGVAVTQESEDYVIRAILVGPQNSKRLVIPFLPQLLAGRSLTPNAPSILPDDTEIMVSASFDFSKTFQEMLVRLEESNKERVEGMHKVIVNHRTVTEEQPYDPFGKFEKKGGFKIKDELLPAFGNEIAIASSMKSLQGAGAFGVGLPVPGPQPRPAADGKETDEMLAQKKLDEQSSPAVLIAVRDREAARRLMPKVLDGLGIGAANMLSSTVKRDDTEMVDFAGAFAYGFVGDFLVISTTPTVRHIIDSHLNHQTLASNSAYRSFTRWQPSGVIGQIYVSPVLMESFNKAAHDPSQTIAAAMREYLLRLNPTPQAITYALAHDGSSAFHELHLPKSLVLASIAGAASATKEPPPEMNEAVAMSLLRMVAGAENNYKAGEGKGSYASLDKLVAAKLIAKGPLDKYGYRIEVTVSGAEFEATATPVEYGKTGRMSYFIDASNVLRGGDHGGGPASLGDKPMQ